VTIQEARRDFAGAATALEGLLASPRTAQEVAENAGTDRVFLVHLGFAYEQLERYKDAAEAVRRAVATGEPADANLLGQYGEALAVEPDSAPVLNYLGYMNAERSVRLDEAFRFIEKAVAIDPENGAYLDSMGWALFRLDRLDQAEQFLRKAVGKPGANAVVM